VREWRPPASRQYPKSQHFRLMSAQGGKLTLARTLSPLFFSFDLQQGRAYRRLPEQQLDSVPANGVSNWPRTRTLPKQGEERRDDREAR
jgi:hypothetical protein